MICFREFYIFPRSGKGGPSRPTSRQFDADKPHWTLRVVVDASEGQTGDCDIRKDTERLEQIRAMKQVLIPD